MSDQKRRRSSSSSSSSASSSSSSLSKSRKWFGMSVCLGEKEKRAVIDPLGGDFPQKCTDSFERLAGDSARLVLAVPYAYPLDELNFYHSSMRGSLTVVNYPTAVLAHFLHSRGTPRCLTLRVVCILSPLASLELAVFNVSSQQSSEGPRALIEQQSFRNLLLSDQRAINQALVEDCWTLVSGPGASAAMFGQQFSHREKFLLFAPTTAVHFGAAWLAKQTDLRKLELRLRGGEGLRLLYDENRLIQLVPPGHQLPFATTFKCRPEKAVLLAFYQGERCICTFDPRVGQENSVRIDLTLTARAILEVEQQPVTWAASDLRLRREKFLKSSHEAESQLYSLRQLNAKIMELATVSEELLKITDKLNKLQEKVDDLSSNDHPGRKELSDSIQLLLTSLGKEAKFTLGGLKPATKLLEQLTMVNA